MADIAIQHQKRVLGNIELSYDVEGYIYCKLFSDMVKHICESKLTNVESIVLIDEAGLDFPSYEASSREWKEFDKFAKLTRKFKSNQVFIIQYEHQVPWTLKKHYSAWMHKFDTKTEMRYEIKVGPYKGFDQIISRIPRTQMPYDTEHISGMKIDVEVRDLLDFLERLPPRVNQFEELRKFVDRKRLSSSNEFTAEEKRFLAWKLHKLTGDKPDTPKLSNDDIGKIIGLSGRAVKRYIKESDNA